MANVDDMTQYEKRSLDILESINNKVTTLMNHIVAPVAPMAAAAPVKKILSPEHLPQATSLLELVQKVKDPDYPKRKVSAGLQTWTTLIAETLEEMKAAGWTHPETGKPASRKDAMKAAAAKKAEEAAEAAAAAPAPKAPEPEDEWIRKIISGKKYLWNPANNHVYFSEADGSLGKWAGIYDPKSRKINTTVPEPAKHEGGSRKQKATRKQSKRARKTRRS